MADREEPDAGAERREAEAERVAEESIARIERGGIPVQAERRLREIAEEGGAFTSDLSVADFALCRRLGLRPLAQVMGSSIYQVGYQSTPWGTMGMGGGLMFEMDTLSQAWNEVRQRAFARLAQEAALVGGDAVVGVELRSGRYDWAENAIEYMVIGTAVRHERAPAAGRGPVLTELSVADYAKLALAQIEPIGFVAWSSVFFVAASYATQMATGGLGGSWRNQELPEFTQGIYGARESVMARMTAQAERLGASGVLGARIDHSIHPISAGGGRVERGGLMVSFHAVGTAIREPAGAVVPEPMTTVDLTT
jgi:uncharacterized protein YbjQ (UPF0145 family)